MALHFALLNFSRTHQCNCKSQYPDKGNKAGEATQRSHLGKVAYEPCCNNGVGERVIGMEGISERGIIPALCG